MKAQLLAQLKSWNPWWQQGMHGVERYKDPFYKRELFFDVYNQFKTGNQIISIVGMRQVGKSTIMRQIIRELLESGIDPKNILYISFDDPYLRVSYNQKTIFDEVIKIYAENIVSEDINVTKRELYFFFDEIHQLPQWEKTLKSYYDRSFPIKFVVSGSSSLHLQSKNTESLLGRIAEYTLWPFSFREYVEFMCSNDSDGRLKESISSLRKLFQSYLNTFRIDTIEKDLSRIYQEINLWHKQEINNYFRQFVITGGFPRVWQQADLASQQRMLWEQHVGKVIFEDLPQVAKIRKIKDLEFLFVRLVDYNGKEVALSQLKEDLKIHWETLDRYLRYLIKTFLVFRIERTKTKRSENKKRSGNVKFYLTDIAIRNALHKKTEEVIEDVHEMPFIAENLVCTAVQRWLVGPRREEQIAFYRDKSGEVDFIIKHLAAVMPIEVKWRNDIPTLKSLDKLNRKWGLKESILITKDFELTYKKGRLSIPLWFFLLAF